MNSFRQSLTSAAVATALLASFALPSFAQTTAPDAAPAAVTAPAKPDAGRGLALFLDLWRLGCGNGFAHRSGHGV